MAFIPLASEAWQSEFENTVLYNLADSGVDALQLGDLVAGPGEIADLLNLDLRYPDVLGTLLLRELIADWYGGHPDQVLVTVGSTEANSIAVAALVRPGDHVVIMTPGYQHLCGCVLNAGGTVTPFPLQPGRGWRPDLAALESTVTSATRLIALINPNNPTGVVLTAGEMAAIVDIAQAAGAWLLADEVFRGTERLTDSITPSFFGLYERTACIGSLSKAFCLPGLRLGWLIAPAELTVGAQRRHEYATIAASTLSMRLGEIALGPDVRNHILARTKLLIRDRYRGLQRWVDASDGLVSIVPPQATALGFAGYNLDMASMELAHLLRTEGDVLVCPGVTFGAEGHLRLNFGLSPDYLQAALSRIIQVLQRHR
jgi:aspartate/methionine/tyrosine aminotransferase